ncbi:acyltransferase [Novosphingobium sp. BW1]|uniref:acyltransferase family protein n=1 Tax=Novosphingobium sp. BW1 TaxID=2592621 RepID=UPI0011DEEF41|nr:acyltransferase [Novosphingobium sp. BW1]
MAAGQSLVQEPVAGASFGPDQPPRHFPALDGARGVAAMAVVVSHCANAGFFLRIPGEGTGQMGVLLFVLLSGFLMAFLYGQRSFTNRQVMRYATHRIARVFPLFYLVLARVYRAVRYVLRYLSAAQARDVDAGALAFGPGPGPRAGSGHRRG